MIQAAEPVVRAELFLNELAELGHFPAGLFELVLTVRSRVSLCAQRLGSSVWWIGSFASAIKKTTEADVYASVAVTGSSFSSKFVYIPRTNDCQLRKGVLCQ